MPERRPLVTILGEVKELPTGDTLPAGAHTHPATEIQDLLYTGVETDLDDPLPTVKGRMVTSTYAAAAANVPPAAPDDANVVLTLRQSSTAVIGFQLAHPNNSDLYFRNMSGTWAPWRKLNLEGARGLVRVVRAAAQAISTAAWTTIVWDSEQEDSESAHSTVTGQITIPTGVTRIKGTVQIMFQGHATGERILAGRKNGTAAAYRGYVRCPPAAATFQVMHLNFDITCVATDVIDFAVWQNSGGNLNIQATSVWNWLHAEFF